MERLESKYICFFMMALIIVYYFQGAIYPIGSIISQLCFVLLMVLSSVYFVFFNFWDTGKKSLLVRTWTAFLLLNCVYFLFEGTNLYLNAFQNVLLNMLPFYAFFIFTKRGVLKRKHLVVFFVFLLPLIVLRFLKSNLELQFESGKEDVVDNTVYMFLGLLPFIFLFKRKILSIAALATIWVFLVQSGKRAAIVSGSLTMILYFYYQFKVVSSRKYIFLNTAISLALISVIAIWGYEYFMDNEFLINRIKLMFEGDSAGRDQLVTVVFNSWYNSDNIVHYLFGLGFQTSAKVSTHVSHNDWIEVLAGFGLVGFSIYLVLFYSAFREFLNENWNLVKKISFISLILIAFVVSLTSRWYWSSFPYSQMLLLPYLLASYNNKD